jgi:hypothetical protein
VGRCQPSFGTPDKKIEFCSPLFSRPVADLTGDDTRRRYRHATTIQVILDLVLLADPVLLVHFAQKPLPMPAIREPEERTFEVDRSS